MQKEKENNPIVLETDAEAVKRQVDLEVDSVCVCAIYNLEITSGCLWF